MADPQVDTNKRVAAEAAVNEIEADMIVGLGTGSTAAFAISVLAGRVRAGLIITTVATSYATELAARAAGITVVPFADIDYVDLAIDGADQIDPHFYAIKGGGGALLREKIVASSARHMICIVDDSKPVPHLNRPLPIEVLPFARSYVSAMITALGGDPRLRVDGNGTPLLSDQANILIDCAFGSIADPPALAATLDAIPGILGHGLFLHEVDTLLVGTAHGVERRERKTNAA